MKKAVLCLSVSLLLTGCRFLPQPREMGEMALVRCVGVDPAPEGVSLTLSTGPRAQGTQGGQKPALCLSVEDSSLSAAALAAQTLSDSTVFFGYVDQLLLGETQARQGVEEVLDWLSCDRELSLGAAVWVVRGDTARAAVESGGEDGVDRRLSNLGKEGHAGVAPVSRTAQEILVALGEVGCAYVPTLVRKEQGLQPGGYALLTRDGLAGYLEGEQARGLELLGEKGVARVLEIRGQDASLSARVKDTQVDVKGRFGRDGLEGLEVVCRARVEILSQKGCESERARAWAAREIEGLLAQWARGTLDRLQEHGCDCVGLGSRLAMAHPWYARHISTDWSGEFRDVPIDLRVEVSLGVGRR